MNLDDLSNKELASLAERRRMQEHIEELKEAAQALVTRIDLIHEDDAYKAVWTLAYAHGFAYHGPTYEQELRNLRQTLEEVDNES